MQLITIISLTTGLILSSGYAFSVLDIVVISHYYFQYHLCLTPPIMSCSAVLYCCIALLCACKVSYIHLLYGTIRDTNTVQKMFDGDETS
jgi:hypothetical protein